MLLPTHCCYDSSPIVERTAYVWPDGKRLAFYVSVSIEAYALGAGLGDDFSVRDAPQTQRNYAWRDYGNRVGIWRLLDLFDELNLPAAHNLNSLVYRYYPRILERIRARGDEIIAHGRTSAEWQDAFWEVDEARVIQEVTETILQNEGTKPKGWLGPGLAESEVTPGLLREAGYSYLMDWPCDDQPIWMRTRAGPILALPYSVEINDSFVLVHRQRSAREFADMIVDQFDELVEECDDHPLVCAIGLHPFVTGQPFRLNCLRRALEHCCSHRFKERVWVTRPGEIANYCYSLPPGTIPGSDSG